MHFYSSNLCSSHLCALKAIFVQLSLALSCKRSNTDNRRGFSPCQEEAFSPKWCHSLERSIQHTDFMSMFGDTSSALMANPWVRLYCWRKQVAPAPHSTRNHWADFLAALLHSLLPSHGWGVCTRPAFPWQGQRQTWDKARALALSVTCNQGTPRKGEIDRILRFNFLVNKAAPFLIFTPSVLTTTQENLCCHTAHLWSLAPLILDASVYFVKIYSSLISNDSSTPCPSLCLGGNTMDF